MQFNLADLFFLGSVPVIMAIVEAFKKWASDTRLYPIVAVASGIIINLVIGNALKQGLTISVFAGLIAGFAAGGIYSAVSTYSEGQMADKVKRTKPNNINISHT